MRVLFLNHPESDFLEAIVYSGLCDEIGTENVVDYPYKRSYHGEVHTYPSPYVQDPGSTAWQKWTDTTGVTAPFEWFCAQQRNESTRNEVIQMLRDRCFNLVILTSPRLYNTKALRDLIATVGRDAMRLVMLDGEDYSAIRWDLVEEFRPSVYFKRELHKTEDAGQRIYSNQFRAVTVSGSVPKIRPLPLTSPKMYSKRLSSDVDIAMLGGANRPGGRDELATVIRQFTANHVMGHVAFNEYINTMRRARIVVVPRGHGWDTLRFWETLSLNGPLLLAERTPLHQPWPPVEKMHCDYFDSANDLQAKLGHWLEHEAERATVASAGFNHYVEYHTAQKRAKYVLEEA